METKKPGFFSILFTFMKISSLTLGGGAVMLGLMEEEVINRRKWLDAEEMVNILTMVNSMPGIIGVNSAVLIGRKIAGFPGGLAAATGVLIPSFFIILALSEVILRIRDMEVVSYAFTAVRAAAAGIILMVMIRLFRNMIKNWREWFIASSAFIELRVIGIPAIWVVVISAVWGLLLYGRER